jgi:hypothetical protein
MVVCFNFTDSALDLVGCRVDCWNGAQRRLALGLSGFPNQVAHRSAALKGQCLKSLGDLFDCYAQYLCSEGKKALPHFRYTFERYLGDLPNERRKKYGRLRTKPQGSVNWK